MFAEDIVFCQPSWIMESRTVLMAVTQLGGHMGPVHFCRGDEGSAVDPYYISPWQCEENAVPVGQSEKVLRGDFFCLPFGYAEPEMGCPSHGNTAGGLWSLNGYTASNGVQALSISMQNALGHAHVMRQYYLRDGEEVVYDRTTVTGLSGGHTIGHHAVLRVPALESSMLISTSSQTFGMTYPKKMEDCAGPAAQSLAIGAAFDDLRSVPLSEDTETTDLSVYPAGCASTDLVQVAVHAMDGQPAWTAVVNRQESYLWFSLRDVAVLPCTLMWIENRARQFPPWNGRSCVLGLEDICSFFDLGREISGGENAFSSRGVKTIHEFKADEPTVVSYIQGATRVPKEFCRVRSVEFVEGAAIFIDSMGVKVRMLLDAEFLFGKKFLG